MSAPLRDFLKEALDITKSAQAESATEVSANVYALGLDFYHRLTQTTPMTTDDHCLLLNFGSSTPKSLSLIVEKMLNRFEEDRYHSFFGLSADLKRCLDSLNKQGDIEFFLPGQKDKPTHLKFSDHLYSRRTESDQIIRFLQGPPGFLLITGEVGIGKTALVNDALRDHTFFSGKFDQISNQPYGAWLDAFQELLCTLDIQHTHVLDGRALIDWLPAFERVLGHQSAINEVGPTQSKNRFYQAIQSFISTIAKDRPLIFFLDDLQWADSASLELLHELKNSRIPNLHIIGASRTSINDCDTLSIPGLSEDTIATQIQDIFRISPAESDSLSKVIYKKTQGNPFYIRHTLSTLYEHQKLVFDESEQEWRWSLEDIHRINISDNVAEMVIHRIKELPGESQSILSWAACMGSVFNLDILTAVTSLSKEEVLLHLRYAEHKDLIINTAFSHDRILQALYTSIPEDERQHKHLRIARELVKLDVHHTTHFQIADHFNVGLRLITDPNEKIRVAQINLLAAQKARRSGSFASALNYAASGYALLTNSDASTLSFDLLFLMAECEFLAGKKVLAEDHFNVLLGRCRSMQEKLTIYTKKVVLYTAANQLNEALSTGIDGLKIAGMRLTKNPSKFRLSLEFVCLKIGLFFKKDPTRITSYKENTDAESRAAVALLLSLLAPAYQYNQNLLFLITFRTVWLSMRKGIQPGSSAGFIALAIILIVIGQFEQGRRFAELASDINERLDDDNYSCMVDSLNAIFASHWLEPHDRCQEVLVNALEKGKRTGDLTFSTFTAVTLLFHLLSKGETLSTVDEALRQYRDFVQSNPNATLGFEIVAGLIERLTHNTQIDLLEEKLSRSTNRNFLCSYYIYRMMGSYLLSDPRKALAEAKKAENLIEHARGLRHIPIYYFFHFLALASVYNNTKHTLKKLEKMTERMRSFSQNCPSNFSSQLKLMEAEMARIQNQDAIAELRYAQAIELAQKLGFIQNAAISAECASRYYQTRDPDRAKDMMTRAIGFYDTWGAKAKVAQLTHK